MEARDPKGVALIATLASWAFLAGSAALALASLNTIRVLGGLGGVIAPHPALVAADALSMSAGLFYLLTFVVAGFAVAFWIYATNRNAQTWSAFVEVTPGWNIGWFFVPIANLFKPFEGVRETYQASVDPELPADVPVPAAMRWWWGAWIAGGVHGWLSGFATRQAHSLPALIGVRWFAASALPIHAVQVIAFVAVVRATTRAQRARLCLA